MQVNHKNGMIKIPSRYKLLNSKHIKVVAEIDDSETNNQLEKKPHYSNEYIEKHWRELIMTSSTNPRQDDDKIVQEEYGKYLSKKHSI